MGLLINKDESHDDDEIVHFGTVDIPLSVARQRCDEITKLGAKQRKIILMYDNFIQYTSLGLMDLLYEIFDIKAPFPLASFFERNIFADEWVYNFAEAFDIPKETVDEIESTCYSEVLKRSPFTNNAEAFMRMRGCAEAQLIVFKYKFPGVEKIIVDLERQYKGFNGKNVPIKVDFRNGASEETYINATYTSKAMYYEIAIVENAKAVMKLVEQNKLDVGSNILTYFTHNGMTDGEKAETVALLSPAYDYRINFMKEGFLRNGRRYR